MGINRNFSVPFDSSSVLQVYVPRHNLIDSKFPKAFKRIDTKKELQFRLEKEGNAV